MFEGQSNASMKIKMLNIPRLLSDCGGELAARFRHCKNLSGTKGKHAGNRAGPMDTRIEGKP